MCPSRWPGSSIVHGPENEVMLGLLPRLRWQHVTLVDECVCVCVCVPSV